MRNGKLFITFILLLIAQICICNYVRLTQFVTISLLPTMILMLPIRKGNISSTLIALIVGFAVDFLSDGVMGLNIAALLPVAYFRSDIIKLICGREVYTRKEDISFERQGAWKMSIAIILAQSIFLAIYIMADGADTRPMWFCLTKFGISLAVNYFIALLFASSLAPEKYSSAR